MRVIADIVLGLVSILKGMWVTLVNFFRPKVTELYPRQPVKLSPRWRGGFVLWWDKERQRLKCTACLTCARSCPAGVFRITGKGTGKDRQARTFDMNLNICMFCRICEEVCPFDAIAMQPEIRPATYDPNEIPRNIRDLAEKAPEEQQAAWEEVVSGKSLPASVQPAVELS